MKGWILLSLVSCSTEILRLEPPEEACQQVPLSSAWKKAGDGFVCADHTASAVIGGVVVVGRCAFAGEDLTLGAWMYRTEDDGWSSLEAPVPPRSHHAAATLLDGRVLIAGGLSSDEDLIPNAAIFDPDTLEWSPAGRPDQPRAGSSATVLPDGRVLVAGGIENTPDIGQADSSALTELFDPASRSWTLGPPLLTARSGHGAVVLPDGRAMVIAGDFYRAPCCDQRRALHSTEIIDVLAGTQVEGPPLPANLPVVRGAVVTSRDEVVVISGALYRLDDDSWDASEPFARPYPAVAEVADGRILIVGDSVWQDIRTPQIYDLDDGRWEIGPEMIDWGGHTGNATATRLPEDAGVLLVGGGVAQIYQEPMAKDDRCR
jgi:hypothetical protein